ncbi:MAG: CBS domain-containing protein [Candidatus Methanomethylophilaceae archaeon]|nr:CBS domain-containing protein [Candidatus Methanomethylophilaceae archaeon]
MKTVEDVMVKLPIVVEVPGSRSDAINIMVRNNVTGLPVVRAADGCLVGIVSRKDVFNNFQEDQLSLIMKKDIIKITPDTSIRDAAKIFVEKRIHRLPVVENGKLIGLITPTDLLDEVKNMRTSMTAEQVINTTCVTAYVNDPISYVVNAMRVSRVTSFPVLDARGALVGIITDRDMFIDQTKDIKVLKELGVDEASQSLAGYRNVLPLFYMATEKDISEELIVKDYMVKNPTTVFKKTNLSEIAKIMKQNNFGQIPVRGNKDELVAMIYDIDVLNALIG